MTSIMQLRPRGMATWTALCTAGLLAASGAWAQEAPAPASGYNFRVLQNFGTAAGAVAGAAPSGVFHGNSRLYGATTSGGTVSADGLNTWGRVYSFTPGAADYISQDAAAVGGQDLGKGTSFSLSVGGVLYGARPYVAAVTYAPGVAVQGQSAAIVAWNTGTAGSLPQIVANVGEGGNLTPQGQWTADPQGNLYIPASVRTSASDVTYGFYRYSAQNGLERFLQTGVRSQEQPNVTVNGNSRGNFPLGNNALAVLYSNDDGGTLYAVTGASLSWNGTYPNASIPEGELASAAILRIRLADIRADGTTPATFLQSLAGTRDGSVSTSGRDNHLVEVGGWLYGTTQTSIWRYNKAAGAGGAIEQVHAFAGGASDGTFARGPLVLAADGYVYGTTYAGGSATNAQQAGVVFRFKPGNADVGEDGASYEIVHQLALATDGARPTGLVAGDILEQPDGSAIQTLYGTAQFGGPGAVRNTAGSGTVFAFDVAVPASGEAVLAVQPAAITVGQSATLNWTVSRAGACVAESSDGSFTGDVSDAQGSRTLAPTAAGTYRYTLTCTDARGEARTSSATLAVSAVNGGETGGGNTGGGSGAQPGQESGGGGGGGAMGALLALLAASALARRRAPR